MSDGDDKREDERWQRLNETATILCDTLGELNADLAKSGVVPASDHGGELLHTLAVTWIDRLADAGLVDRKAPEIDALTHALASLSAQVQLREEGQLERVGGRVIE